MRKAKLQRPHITEARFRGSEERIVGNDGHINAGSQQEVLNRILEIAQMVSSSEIQTDVSHRDAMDDGKTNRQILEEAYHDGDSNDWAELGSGLASELQTRMLRDGFMRSILERGDVAEGSIVRHRVRTPNVTAVASRGVAQTYPQYVRDRYMVVEEFTIDANPRVEELDMHQGSGDILEDKFYEAQEAILVQEDRTLIALLDATAGIHNTPIYFTGLVTPTIFRGMRQAISDWNLPAPTSMIMANDIMYDLQDENTSWISVLNPVTQYEILQTGRIGNIYGMDLITDGFREESLQVIDRGSLYATTAPNYLGSYTDRGPVRSNPRDQYDDGVPARGWYMYEHISAVIGNAKGATVAKRQ